MDLMNSVKDYVNQPFPLWECVITERLVEKKWEDLKKNKIADLNDYTTVRAFEDPNAPIGTRFPISIPNYKDSEIIYLEVSAFDRLNNFYQEHGLELYTELELEENAVMAKLANAMKMFSPVESVSLCITKLVRSIQILKQEDSEIDMSYSHPKIPFSIFLSVCPDSSPLSCLRIAESILHEAMHLKLTLIENVLPLIQPGATGLFFSPWREEKRPAQGVIHGLFVFRAVWDYLNLIAQAFESDQVLDHIYTRKEQIAFEFEQIRDFTSCPDLTEPGAILAQNLLDPIQYSVK